MTTLLGIFSIIPGTETAFLSRNKIRDSPGENSGGEIKSWKWCIRSSLSFPYFVCGHWLLRLLSQPPWLYSCLLCLRARGDFFPGDAISSNQSVRRVNQLIDWSPSSQDLAPLWLALAWPWGKRLGTFNYPQQLLHWLNGQWVYYWGGTAWIIIENNVNAGECKQRASKGTWMRRMHVKTVNCLAETKFQRSGRCFIKVW